MECPICEESEINIEFTHLTIGMGYMCGRCKCIFGSGGELIDYWTHCAKCYNYVLPENQPNRYKALCLECSEETTNAPPTE